MIETIWLGIKTVAQLIWAILKGAAIGLWNNPTLLFFIVIAIIGGIIAAKLFKRR